MCTEREANMNRCEKKADKKNKVRRTSGIDKTGKIDKKINGNKV